MEEEKIVTETQGTQNEETTEKVFCVKCGKEILEGQLFCTKCGHKVGEKLDLQSETNELVKASSNSKIKIIISVVAAMAVILIAVFMIRGAQAKSVTLNKDNITVKIGETVDLSFTIDPDNTKNKTVTWTSSNESIAKVNDGTISGINEGDCTVTVKTKNGKTDICAVVVTPAGPDLQAIYNEYCTSSFASIASDGSYLFVDTNPKDKDDYTDYEAYLAIVAINKALELPESVWKKMGQTRSIDGMQSYSTSELDIDWTYHPNNGLEVNYTIKK